MNFAWTMELLIPSWSELAGWGGVFVAGLLFIGCGRLLSAGRAAPEAALLAGWGFACVLLTVWGVVTATSLLFPAAAFAGLGVVGFLPKLAPDRAAWRSMLRLGVIAVPLLAIMASARPSQPDTFLNLLPNSAYLWDHAAFPADDRAPAYSLLPAAPYNMQLASFIVSAATWNFSMSAMIGFNIVLQLAFALFLARLIEGSDDDRAVPSWAAAALGLLLTTVINPGFVDRYDFSAYSEPSVTVATAFAAWFAARALESLAARRPAGGDLALLALTLSALVNIKQDSVALAAAVVATAAALALWQEAGTRARSVGALLLAALPAGALYLAWRWYVLGHFAAGELKLQPVAQWQFDIVPLVLRNMAAAVARYAYFFAAAALALAGLLWRWRRAGLDRTTRVAALFAGVAILYNAALLFTYVAHFDREIGAAAHSYFRYNSHLGLLLMLTLTLLARDVARERRWALVGIGRRVGGGALLAVAMAAPIAGFFFGFLRFDLEAAQQRCWQLAALARQQLDKDPHLALILPADNGSLSTMLAALIRFTPPRHRDAVLGYEYDLSEASLGELAQLGYRYALFSCRTPEFEKWPFDNAGLMERHADGRWLVLAFTRYAPAPLHMRASHVLAEAPLCL
jgi:hypothetical protein